MAKTVATKGAFRDAHKSRRCLAPADGFYEWKKLDAKTKQPYRFVMRDGSPSAFFAGLRERWKEPASGETIKSFTIVTTEPNAFCATVHNRIPFILGAGDYQTWLGEAPESNDELQGLLRPYPVDLMEAQISARVGSSVQNDDAEMIERLNSA